MAESWVRLWAGMTTDPKWQTIARKSGQPRALVIALFTHLMLEANEAEDRGRLDELNIEDTASALDCDEEAVEAILAAMQGRVIEDGGLSGWGKRQPKREDAGNTASGAKSAADRKREQRAREAAEQAEKSRDVTTCHDVSRDVTTCHAPEAEAEAEAEAEEKRSALLAGDPPTVTRKGDLCRRLRQESGIADAAPHQLDDDTWGAILAKRTDEEIVEFAKAKVASRSGQRTGLRYLAPGLLEDPRPITANARASPGGFSVLDAIKRSTAAGASHAAG